MIYVASPYTSNLAGDLKAQAERNRYVKVLDFVAHVMKTSMLPVFSPIVYTHQIATKHQLPGDAEHWLRFNTAFLRQAEVMFVLRIQGWENSKGMEIEMRMANMLGIPIVHFNDKFEEVVLQ